MRRTLPLSAALLLALTASPASALDPGDGVLYDVSGATGGSFGWAISELADVDGDGVTDWITGAPFAGGGYVEVYSGATGSLLWHVDGTATLAWAIADAGDVNGDGVHDVIAGAPDAQQFGASYALVLDGATGAELLRLENPDGPSPYYGYSVGDAGDVDGDGAADVLVGSAIAGAAGEGAVFVHSGADGSVLRRYDGLQPRDAFGSAADAVDDIDGDGETDHVIGAFNAGTRNGGAVYVFSGADGSLIHELTGTGTSVVLGDFFAAGLDDVDGDGVADIYGGDYADNIGASSGNRNTRNPQNGPSATALAHRADPSVGRTGTGRAYVWSGATGERIHMFHGATPAAGMGPGRGAGDVDGDGHEDLAVGSYTSSVDATSAGQVTVFSGATGEPLLDLVNDVAFEGMGFDAVGLGDLDGDGIVDLLVSAASGNRVYAVSTG